MQEQKKRVYNKIFAKIKKSDRIALLSHKDPDGDTLGSATAFYEFISKNFKKAKLDLLCPNEVSEKLNFIPYSFDYKNIINLKDYDLFIFFDSSSLDQSFIDKKDLFHPSVCNSINIDHHLTNNIFARQNLVMSDYCSTSLIVYEFFKLLNIDISKNMATSLLTWIYTDTWWLKHSNTDSFTYKACFDLISKWADREIIISSFFKNNSLKVLKFWWKVINKSFIDNKNVLNTYINKTDLESHKALYSDVSWIVDLLNSVEDIKYCKILTQKWEYVKWSLRTLRDDIDLTKIAKKFWWAWHKKASGFTAFWEIKEIMKLDFKKINENT